MKNLAQIYLLAALTAAPPLMADMSPLPQFNRHFQPMGDPKPESEKFFSGLAPTTEAFGLGKRQTRCQGNSYPCPNTNWCCPNGSNCARGDGGVRCYICGPGQHRCADGVGFCCLDGYECVPGTAKCLGPCLAGSTRCFDGCCAPGYSCQGPNQPCLKIDTTLATFRAPTFSTFKPITIPTAPGGTTSSTTPVSRPTTTPMTPKAATSSTSLVRPPTNISAPVHTFTPPYITIPKISTYPSPPPTTNKSENFSSSSSSTVSATTGPTSPATAPASGSNAINPGRWVGGFGIVFFFVFFNM